MKVFANISNPKRCVLQLYQKYMSLRPANAPPDVFYLLPLRKTLPDCWYQPRPVGHNPLSHTVQKLCTEIGVEGYYTNHSLRRTCATRLYQKGADEQQIMSITGHRSSTAVGSYKNVSHHQQEELSRMLQSSDAKKQKVSDKENQAPNTMIVTFEVKYQFVKYQFKK